MLKIPVDKVTLELKWSTVRLQNKTVQYHAKMTLEGRYNLLKYTSAIYFTKNPDDENRPQNDDVMRKYRLSVGYDQLHAYMELVKSHRTCTSTDLRDRRLYFNTLGGLYVSGTLLQLYDL